MALLLGTIGAMKFVLSIAGSDPTGGAGLQLDLQVFHALGVRGGAVVTAITQQDTAKVHQVLPIFPSVVLEQLRVLLRDITPAAIKIGMLASDDVARNVLLGLTQFEALKKPRPPTVLDPVLAASDGTPLLERRAWGTLIEFFPSVTLVTPNLIEAERLSGLDVSTAANIEHTAVYFLEELLAPAVLIKGGHAADSARDLLAQKSDGKITFTWFEGEHLDCGPVRGTGCALSSAIAARLAQGDALEVAIRRAKAFVTQAIARAQCVGAGAKLLDLH